jgi:hypothetical protein
MNTTTPDERSEKDGLAREPRELSSEELESIIGGVEVGIGTGSSTENIEGIEKLKGYGGSVAIIISGDWEKLKGYGGAVAVTAPVTAELI